MCAQKLNPCYKQQKSFREHATHSRSHLSIATTRSWGSDGSRHTIHAILTRRTSISSRSLKHKTTSPFKTPEQRGSCEHLRIRWTYSRSSRSRGASRSSLSVATLQADQEEGLQLLHIGENISCVFFYRIVSSSFVLIYKLSSEPFWKRHLQQVRADQPCRRILCVPCGLCLQPHQPLLCLPWLQQDPGWR